MNENNIYLSFDVLNPTIILEQQKNGNMSEKKYNQRNAIFLIIFYFNKNMYFKQNC